MRIARVLLQGLALVLSLSCGLAIAQAAPPKPAALTIDLAQQKPWTGDLDGMIARRAVRVLTVNSKTFFFVDKGVNRGIVVDYFRLFEDDLNKKLAAQGKLKNR